MILLADLHLGLSQDNSLWHDTAIALANEVHDTCIKNDIDEIAILGDIFDNRKSMNHKTQDVAWHIMTVLWKDFNIILVRGNHDTYYKDRPNPNWLRMFEECSNVITVETEPYISVDKCFVPWGYDISELPWGGFLFGHFEINNFRMNNFYECRTSNISAADFRKFKQVYAGHFHFPQNYANITYLGSPHHHDFGDVGSQRGYYIWEDGTLEFIEFTNAPKFVIIKTNEEITPEDVQGNIVKLVFDRDYGTNKNNELVERVEFLDPAALTVDTRHFNITSTDIETEDENVIIKDNNELLREFMGKNIDESSHLNKKTLYKVLDLLTREVESDG